MVSSAVHHFWLIICLIDNPEAKKMRNKVGILALAFLLATPLMAATSESKESHKAMQKEAKISMKKARSIALKKAPGKVSSAELERENGKLIYSFDIKNSSGGTTEVNVDAITGEIVSAKLETKAEEKAEKKMEAKEKPPIKH
jgi:uncharacterized protein YpmB